MRNRLIGVILSKWFIHHTLQWSACYCADNVAFVLIGEQFLTVVVNEPPVQQGNCKVVPPFGYSFDTKFNIICDPNSFADEDLPLTYDLYSAMDINTEPVPMLSGCK